MSAPRLRATRYGKIAAVVLALLLPSPIFLLYGKLLCTQAYTVGSIDSLLARSVAFSFIATVLLLGALLLALPRSMKYSIGVFCYFLLVAFSFADLWRMGAVVF